MNYEEAKAAAEKTANITRTSTLVYRRLLKQDDYNVAFTLPPLCEQVGDRVEPEEEYEPAFHPAWAKWDAIVTGRTKATPAEEAEAAQAAAEEGYAFKRIFY